MQQAGDGVKRVTIRDVAGQAGVSLSSVSRVMSDHPDISPDMRQRVRASAASLGYEPDLIAQSLRRGVTQTLGFLIGDIANPVMADVIRGAEDNARSNGYAVMFTNSEGQAQLDEEHLRLFLRRRVDGIILLTAETGSQAVAEALREPAVPYVVIDRDVPPASPVGTVYADHAMGMEAATSHLINKGHRLIALLTGNQDLRPARERQQGFRAAFHGAGLEPPEHLIRRGSLLPGFGKAETTALLRDVDRPTALIAGGNRLLIGVLEALNEMNIRVGKDIALVSCDDVDLTRLYQPPISVVKRDLYHMGQVACDLLVERLRNKYAPVRSITLPTQFVARPSSEFAWASLAS